MRRFATLAALALAACGELPAYQPCDDENPCAVDRVCEDGVCVQRRVDAVVEEDAAPPETDMPGCVPAGDEICGDGVDNNCDGQLDEGFTFEGLRVGEVCDGIGECGLGTVVCTANGAGALCSTNPGGPQHVAGLERCDGLDNDCDGVVDNGQAWNGLAVGAACLEGTGCGAGTVICAPDGTPVCDTLENVAEETCNGTDDDCDGETDEGFAWNEIALGMPCAGLGACGAGVVECANGVAVCSVNPDGSDFPGVPEICDGIDNDCDGETDEDFALGEDCSAGEGTCAVSGTTVCAEDGASAVCDATPGEPGLETCNGLDDDCNGVADDGLLAPDGQPVGALCAGRGRCPEGTYVCAADGTVICSSLPPSPDAPTADEICNDIDDDCDGVVDNGLVWEGLGVGEPCDPVGECGPGRVVCGADGRPICSTAPGGPGAGDTPEICDAADNDCDGEVDEDFRAGAEALGLPCDPPGACTPGRFECSADHAGVRCDTGPGGTRDSSVAERCNGLDDDCDGEVDEDFVLPGGAHVGEACDGVGACGAGLAECTEDGAALRCSTDPGGSAFAPNDELCNGEDDDCDGQTDEEDPRLCGACAVDGAQGLCAFGAFQCEAGRLTCVAHLPPAGPAAECDGLDNDCDGRVDESEEEVQSPDAREQAVLTACGPAPSRLRADPASCAIDPDPARPECAVWHQCVDPLCRAGCQTRAFDAARACEDTCAGDDPGVRSACLLQCRGRVAAEEVVCRRDCAPADPVAFGFTCGGGPAGAACVPTCPGAYRAEGGRCVPRGEICNNGLDDDADGVIDGALAGPEVCSAPLAPASDPWPELVRYGVAVDREEVSHRAYLQCVLNGCCQPAAGRMARLAEAAQSARPDGQRPPDERIDRCEDPPLLDDPDQAEAVLDLPVTGISWCQARDFCRWAGKRLPTDLELSYAGAGEGAARELPWGGPAPADCAAPDDCFAQYAGSGDVCGEPEGATPVWANADGASPEGLLNLTGNVSEWAFDWAVEEDQLVLSSNAAGSECGLDGLDRVDRRQTRGAHYAAAAAELGSVSRWAHHPSWRSPWLGFRCARTLEPEGNRCGDNVPLVRGACLPPPLADGRQEVPCGPDFTAVGADEIAGLCGGSRVDTDTCAASVARVCPSDAAIGCDALAIRHMRLATENLPGFDPVLAREITGLFDLALAPKGGESWFVLDAPPGFGDNPGVARADVGSAFRLGAGLRWLGTSRVFECNEATRAQGVSLNVGPLGEVTSCGEPIAGELWGQDVPIRLRWSALGLQARWSGPAEALVGAAGFVISEGDAAQSILGGEGLTTLFQRAGMPPVALCFAGAAIPGCGFGAGLLPGCQLDGTCADPNTCSGWVLPFEIAALRVSRGVADGQLEDLACP